MAKMHLITATVFMLIPICVFSQNATTPGAISTPYPTITNIGIEWNIQGDANYNATCTVKFKKSSETTWHDAMALKRVAAGQSQGTTPIYKWENKFSGSIFNLQPNTKYDVQLSLNDPDGGKEDTTISVATRPVPRVTSFCEIINVPDGSNGTLTITRNGTQSKPLVYQSTSRKASYSAVTMDNRKWVYLIGLKINGSLKMRSTENCVVQRCSVIVANANAIAINGEIDATNCYIADNVVLGPVKFIGVEMGAAGTSMAEGIQLTGCGNVVRNNFVKGFHDCLSHMEDDEVSSTGQIGNDWMYNEVMSGLDDGIEADFAFNNCRVIANRFTDCFNAMSSKPSLGGPTYFIRNVVFNAAMGSFKLNRYSVGDVILHNTIIKAGDGLCTFDGNPFDWAIWRNNMALGGTTGGWDGSQVTDGYSPGSGYACNINACGSHCSYDYDAVGTYKTTYQARICGQNFSTVEPHGRRIDSTAFANFKFPSPPAPEPSYYYQPQDLRPAPSCTSVVDKALLIPNINDSYQGNGPDIGAYEAGQDLPLYGPRPEGVDEQTPYDGQGVIVPISQSHSPLTMKMAIISIKAISSKVEFRFNLAKSGNYTIGIFNVSGKLIWKSAGKGAEGTNTATWIPQPGRKVNGAYIMNISQESRKDSYLFNISRF